MSIAMTIFSLIGTFIIGFSMFPQTIATFKSKDTATLSLPLYLVMGIATAFITIYGIGLVIIPNPQTLSGNEQYELAKLIGAGSFSYTGAANDVSNASWMDAVKTNWVLSFIVPGAAIIFGELICSVTSFIVAFLKLSNMRNAKKLGISEAEYVSRMKAEANSRENSRENR